MRLFYVLSSLYLHFLSVKLVPFNIFLYNYILVGSAGVCSISRPFSYNTFSISVSITFVCVISLTLIVQTRLQKKTETNLHTVLWISASEKKSR
jgi:hypothetical protein